MRYYPIFLDIKEKPCLVVGGGNVAKRKVEGLLRAGAKVYVVARELSDKLNELKSKSVIIYMGKQYSSEYLDKMSLVIVATDDRLLNERIANECRKRAIPCNVVDVPDLCSFIVPSIVERGDLLIAISTSGASPAMAKKLRKYLENFFGPEYSTFLYILREVRKKILARKDSVSEQNKIVFQKLVDSPIISWLQKGDMKKVDEYLKKELGAEFGIEKLGIGPNLDKRLSTEFSNLGDR